MLLGGTYDNPSVRSLESRLRYLDGLPYGRHRQVLPVAHFREHLKELHVGGVHLHGGACPF